MAIEELKPQDLRKKINLRSFPFQTTAEISPLDEVIGQDRAIRALELALNMEHSGYNVFVTGLSGTGKTTIVQNILHKMARDKPVPNDWIYVYNFDDPDSPQALQLPPGQGKVFQSEMAQLLTTLKKEIPETFNSEEYNKQKMAIVNRYNEKKRRILNDLEKEAVNLNLQVQSTSAGFQTLVMKNGEPLGPEDFEKLSEAEKKDIEERIGHMQEKIGETVRQVVKIERELQQEIRQMNEEIATFIVTRYITELQVNFKETKAVVDYLDRVSNDLITNIGEFLKYSEREGERPAVRPGSHPDHFRRYEVNVIVSNDKFNGAPVIYEPNPTYMNLFGRIEKQMIMGAQVTDFTMIKSGSLHRANGGYLVTDAFQLLKNPFVYDALKRAIKTRQIRIEDISELYGFAAVAGLRPEAIPLNLKVILIGWNQIYYLLQNYDQDFSKIFKIRADFDYETRSDQDSITKYAHFIRKVCDEEGLLPFDRTAVREIIYYAHRLVDDQKKISLQFGALMGIIREANYFARNAGRQTVLDRDVQKAIREYEFRHGLVEEKIREMYERDIYKIDTSGEKVGQINGLSVYSVGGHLYGKPGKITVKSYIGSENVINIERKARLSGKIHDKGWMILNGFFNANFGMHMPLSFSASLTFEQSYSTIDGDSASSTELYVLLSSLANVPIKQGIAVTGSVNQNGEIQAIGGVNQKIEGFYAICKAKGLTGEQGVLIPRSNKDNLMLKDEVIQAVRNGKFHIWMVDTIEDGLKILTGMEAGERLPNGRFPKNTIYNRVENQLRTFAKRSSAFRKSIEGKDKKDQEKKDKEKENNNETPEEE
ncbi:MAG: ATP-binding protein [Calditrichia bacterium]